MKTAILFIICLAIGRHAASAEGLAIASMLRYVTTGDFDPVPHKAQTNSLGLFSSAISSSASEQYGCGGFGTCSYGNVNWGLSQASVIDLGLGGLTVTGTNALETGGWVTSNTRMGSVYWDDANHLDLLFHCDRPCEFAFSVDSEASQSPAYYLPSIQCYASLSGGPPGAANTYLFGCSPPYGWTNQVLCSGGISGVLPAGTFHFQAILDESESASVQEDPTGQFPPSGGLSCHGLLKYSLLVRYPAALPNIISHRIADDDAVLEFQAVLGTSYRLEYRDSLNAGQWQTLPSVVGTGGPLTITNTLPGTGSRFYRVRAGD